MSAPVTGWAWRLPLGSSIEGAVSRLLKGERALADDPAYSCRFACPIREEPRDPRHRRFLPRLGLLALEAIEEACAMAALRGGERVGLFAACGGLQVGWDETLPALCEQSSGWRDPWERGLGRLHPFWLLRRLSNSVHALGSVEIGARGEGATFGGASSGAQALSAAIRALEAGAIDAAVVVAHDSLLEPESRVALAARGAASTAKLEELASPYDEAAGGFLPGEAAAAMVLERAAGAEGRALALVDAAATADGSEAEPGARTLARVLARVARGDEVIDGAAAARRSLDDEERAALSEVIGPRAALLALSSATGQLGAAGPLVQAIALAELLRGGMLAPIAGLHRPAPGPLRPLAEPEPTRARSALGLSAGAPGLAGAIRVEVAG